MSKYTNALRTLQYYTSRLCGLVRHKGVTTDSSEKLDELINKVKNIKQRTDILHGTWTTPVDSETFTWSGLKFLPARIGISSQDVMTNPTYSTTTTTYVGALTFDFENLTETEPGLFTYTPSGNPKTLSTLDGVLSANVTERDVAGVKVYDLVLSFADYNALETTTTKIFFRHTYEYEFVIASREWFAT